MVIATASSYGFCNVNHLLDGPVHVRWSENAKYVVVFYRKVHNFQMVIVVSKTSHICYKPVSTEY